MNKPTASVSPRMLFLAMATAEEAENPCVEALI